MPTNPTDKSTEPTASTSATDASTTEGAKAAGVTAPTATPSSAGGAATAAQENTPRDPVRVEITAPEPAPEVHYPGDVADATDPGRKHVKADYKPFEW